MQILLLVALSTFVGVLLFTLFLSLIRRGGDRFSDVLCRAPALDIVVGLFTLAPPILGVIFGGWPGLVGAVLGQVVALYAWVFLHELAHREAVKRVRLVKSHNNATGRLRNHMALWFSAVAVPVFWIVRFGEYIIYPPMCWIIGFPSYKQGDWVNVSRHKFEGLVGHDLIWCLYCDWMTGVYSLGGEMLRNIESYWCPIRFYDGKKCENCRIDFPDIDQWAVPEGGNIDNAVALFDEQYGGGRREWLGHPARLTVEGEPHPVEAEKHG